MENITGRDIGKYHIVEQLGTGGMAVVYKAFDTSLERNVAIKFIRKETIGEQYFTLLQQRFEREAKVLASLDHPNIVTILEYGQYQGSPYLVMKFIPCGALRTNGRPMAYLEAARLLLPIARALEYAHRRGVIHRDLKPSNILICENGDPTLSDFGIAKILDAPADGSSDGLITSLTGTGLPIGTPEYMAPEQWQGKPCPQSDIYGLGVVLYELLTGRRPYTADTPAAVMIKQVTEPLPRPRDFAHGLPEEVENILFKALALKPENRYASMGDFVRALEQAAQHTAAQAALAQDAAAPAVRAAPPQASPPAAVPQAAAPAAAVPVPVPEKVILTDYGVSPVKPAAVPVTVTQVEAPVIAKAAPAARPTPAPCAAPQAGGPAVRPRPAQSRAAPGKPRRPALLLLLGGAGIGLVVLLLLIGWVVSGVVGAARANRTTTQAAQTAAAQTAAAENAAAETAVNAAPVNAAAATGTETPSPTVTNTTVPSLTPRPTQTMTETTTVTQTAAVNAPATLVPTRTYTLVPVTAATNTPKPAPTSTPKPAPTSTPKPAPTNTPIPPQPSATSASRPATPTPP